MTLWRQEHGRRTATEHTLSILSDVEQEMLKYEDPRPSVTAIRIGAGRGDLHDFEVEVEFAPGALVAIRYQSVNEEGRRPDDLENESGAVACLVAFTVRDLHEVGFGPLAEQLHELRIRARKILAEWGATGTSVTLVDIRIVCDEYWIPSRELPVEARLRSLNDGLRPAIFDLQVDHPDRLLTELVESRQFHEASFATQSALAKQGADGSVDRLVLNAIAQYEDADKAWRTIASGRPYWGSERLTVYMSDGHVRCHGRSTEGRLSWNRDSVTVAGQCIPEIGIAGVQGLPITSLIEHPVLSDDMIVSGASPAARFGGASIRIELAQPRLLFCSASGRVWLPDL